MNLRQEEEIWKGGAPVPPFFAVDQVDGGAQDFLVLIIERLELSD